MAKKQEVQLPKHRATAVDAMRSMGVPKAEALNHVNAVPGDTLEEVLKNAIGRRQAFREGRAYEPPQKPPAPPNAIPIAPAGRRMSVLRGMVVPPQQRPQTPPASPQMPPTSPQVAPVRPQMQPAPSAPTPAQQQTIPGFAPPGGPSAAPQPSVLRSFVPTPRAPMGPAATPAGPEPTQKPPFIQIVGAPPGWVPPKPVIRVRAAGQRIPSAPIGKPPTKEAEPPTKEEAPPSKATRPVSISTEKEYNDLPPGTDFIWGPHVWTKPK